MQLRPIQGAYNEVSCFVGELLSPVSLDGIDEVVVAEEAGASSSAAGADSDDSLPQPPTIPLVESIDEGLVPDIIAGTAGTSSVFQSAWVDLFIYSASDTVCFRMAKTLFLPHCTSSLLSFTVFKGHGLVSTLTFFAFFSPHFPLVCNDWIIDTITLQRFKVSATSDNKEVMLQIIISVYASAYIVKVLVPLKCI